MKRIDPFIEINKYLTDEQIRLIAINMINHNHVFIERTSKNEYQRIAIVVDVPKKTDWITICQPDEYESLKRYGFNYGTMKTIRDLAYSAIDYVDDYS